MRSLRRLARDRTGLAGALIVALGLTVALLAPLIAPYDPLAQDLRRQFEGPSQTHLFGTDELGRDILSRIIHGARSSILLAVVAVGIATLGGVSAGLIAGTVRRTDNLIMRGMDVLLAFPGILFALMVVASLGPGQFNGVMAIGIMAIPAYARLTRSQVLAIRESDYVLAARSVGVHGHRLMLVHILPNAVGPLIVYATLGLGATIIVASSLSFVGLGTQPPTPEWGAMVSTAREYLLPYPHLAFFPSVAIFVTVLAFNFLGDGLRDAIDPKGGARA